MRCLKKKIYALSAVAGLALGAFGGTNAFGDTAQLDKGSVTAFTDVAADSWYYPYVSRLTETGVIKGITETSFAPNGTFTVAEAAAVITRYLGLDDQAESRKNAMEVLGVAGADKWYAGYVQLLYEAGVIDVSSYGCSVMGRHISIDAPELLEKPVKRYEFAAFVTRSFELDGTEIRSTVGEGLGHEFIYSGTYDESMLEKYIPYIADYEAIPASYNYYVLKAYYNGIFNGDDAGNFNPTNNLTRAEMAKVTAVIIDSSLRTRIDVNAARPETPGSNETALLPEDSYLVIDGKQVLKPSYTDALFAAEAMNLGTFYENNLPVVSYTRQSAPPSGYAFRVYHFTKDAVGFDVNIAAAKDTSDGYRSLFNPGDRLVLTLVNTQTGETVDAHTFILNGVGAVTQNSDRYLP